MSGDEKDKEKEKKDIRPRDKYFCDECNYKTPFKINLTRHYLSHTEKRPFPCPFMTCSAYSARKNRRPQHIRLEPGDAVQQPGYSRCLKSFRYPHHLQDHIRTHTGETPFKCTLPGCNSAFSLTTQLNRHLTEHATAETKPHKCNLCERSFARKETLGIHLTSHTPTHPTLKYPFICSVPNCAFKCELHRDLVSHMKSHNMEKTHNCSDCSYVGRTAGYLQVHMRAHKRRAKGKEDLRGDPTDVAGSISSGPDEGESTAEPIPTLRRSRSR